MRQSEQSWRSERGSRLWLSMLVGAMEEGGGSQSSVPSTPPSMLEELRTQLSLPASLQSYPTSIFSFRN